MEKWRFGWPIYCYGRWKNRKSTDETQNITEDPTPYLLSQCFLRPVGSSSRALCEGEINPLRAGNIVMRLRMQAECGRMDGRVDAWRRMGMHVRWWPLYLLMQFVAGHFYNAGRALCAGEINPLHAGSIGMILRTQAGWVVEWVDGCENGALYDSGEKNGIRLQNLGEIGGN